MKRIVFYSWQSDRPNSCNRGFIQAALERAASEIAADASVEVEPVIDRDTQNVPGAPDIASTIFSKIVAADVFVADVSIVTSGDGARPSPNPNVLIELGYAMHALGHERIILVLNREFGPIEALPFDLRMRRVVAYDMKADASDRAAERNRLKSVLDEALRTALMSAPLPEATSGLARTIDAIEAGQPNRVILLRQALSDVLKEVLAHEPKKPRDGGTAEELIEGIGTTEVPATAFARVAESVAIMDDAGLCREICRWFGKLYDKYDLPQGFSGRSTNADHDYFRFVGHELFVTLIAFLVRELRWDTLALALDEPIQVRNARHRGAQSVGWEYGSKHLPSIHDAGRAARRQSLHADLLKGRHTEGGALAAIMPFQEFMNGDYFLFLLSATLSDPKGYGLRRWSPWSCLYMYETPMFLHAAERKSVAAALTKLFKLADIDAFKHVVAEQRSQLRDMFGGVYWDNPIEDEDIQKIGTT